MLSCTCSSSVDESQATESNVQGDEGNCRAGQDRAGQCSAGQGREGQGRAGQGPRSRTAQYIRNTTFEQTSIYGERHNACGCTRREMLHVQCSDRMQQRHYKSHVSLFHATITCSMAWRVDTWPVIAATCSGVDPAGAVTSDITSRSTVRTIIDAPASSSRRTHSKLPLTATKCRAVSPFSALLSMYLNSKNQCLGVLRRRLLCYCLCARIVENLLNMTETHNVCWVPRKRDACGCKHTQDMQVLPRQLHIAGG